MSRPSAFVTPGLCFRARAKGEGKGERDEETVFVGARCLSPAESEMGSLPRGGEGTCEVVPAGGGAGGWKICVFQT